MQVDPIKTQLKPPGTKRLKLKCDVLLSTSAFRLSWRRYTEAAAAGEGAAAAPPPAAEGEEGAAAPPEERTEDEIAASAAAKVGRCRLTLSNPR